MLVVKKTRRGRTARTFGLNWERQIAQDFRTAGWSEAKTSRYASKEADDNKVDVVNIYPFSLQAKASSRAIPCPSKVLKEMHPLDMSNYNIYALKLKNKGDFAIMQWSDFMELLAKLKRENIL